ncbi:hypothetical protein ACFL24_01410 [Patescibacteria group bacterium]
MKKTIVALTVVMIVCAFTSTAKVGLDHTGRFDHSNGSWLVWYIQGVTGLGPIAPNWAIIVSDGEAELDPLVGIKLPVRFDVGPSLIIKYDNGPELDEVGALFLASTSFGRVSLMSVSRFSNLYTADSANDPPFYYWGWHEFKVKISDNFGLFLGGLLEGDLYYEDNSPTTAKIGPMVGWNLGPGCLEFHGLFGIKETTDNKLRIRYTVGL